MFGDFSASLSVVTHQHGVTVYHSKGRDLTNIGRLFTERTGNQYIQGDIWNRMISNVYDVGRHSDCEAKVRCNAFQRSAEIAENVNKKSYLRLTEHNDHGHRCALRFSPER